MQNKQLGKYYIQGSCGTGGMGTVFRARDMDLNRPVAVKVVHPHLVDQPNFYDRFMIEARLTAHLSHPHIVDIFDISKTRDPLYFVMPYYPGNLKLYLGRQPDKRLPPAEAARLCTQVAHALQYAHQENIVHGDVKPHNILISVDKHLPESQQQVRAILADFGLARLLEDQDNEETPMFMGSWAYMAPERMDQSDLIDPRSDIYALGVTLFQLLTGHPPFEIKSLGDALRKHAHAAVPVELLAHVSEDLKEIVLRALAKRPEDRFQSSLEMADALEGLQSDLLRQATIGASASGAVVFVSRSSGGDDGQDARTEMITMGGDTTQGVGGRSGRLNSYIAVNQIASQQYALEEQKKIIRIGRSDNNDIVLPSKHVTDAHATLRRTNQGWEVRDLKSTNGSYIDSNRLLPDQEELWKPHQKLRIGPYTLELHATGDTPGLTHADIASWIEPAAVLDDLQPGQEYICRIQLRNQGSERDYVRVVVEDELARHWYRLPQDGVPLAAGGEETLLLFFTPPANQTAGSYPYRLRVESMLFDREPIIIQGSLNIKALANFRVEAYPAKIIDKASCKVTIHNSGNVDTNYTIKSFVPEAANAPQIRFGVLPDNVQTVSRDGLDDDGIVPQMPNMGGFLSGNSVLRKYLPWLFNNPIVQAYRQSQIYQRRLQQFRSDAGRLVGSWPDRKQLRRAKFASALLQRVKVPAGQSREVEFLLETRQGAPHNVDHTQDVQLNVQDTGSREIQQTEIEFVTTARPTPLWLRILIVLVLISLPISLCLGALYVAREANNTYNLGFFPTSTPPPDDPDRDGISTSEELQLGLNPGDDDTDGDGLKDGVELSLGLDPNDQDTDDDGIIDGQVAPTEEPEEEEDATPSATALPPAVATPIPISWDIQSKTVYLIAGDTLDNQPFQAQFSLAAPVASLDQIETIRSAAIVFTEDEGQSTADIRAALGNFYVQPQIDNQPYGSPLLLQLIFSDARRWQVSIPKEIFFLLEQNGRVDFVIFAENSSDLDDEADQLVLYSTAALEQMKWPVLIINSTDQKDE